MKKAMIIILFAVFGLTAISKGQTVIIRPIAPVMIRPACPGPAYVWYGPTRHWNRRQNTYVWINGYWGRPRGWHAHGRYRF